MAAGSVLYTQSGLSSSVEVFAVDPTGTLTPIQMQAVPDGASQEGIVALQVRDLPACTSGHEVGA